jgi:heme/copper-type cytochrome/quinol oxidase subunit 4
MQKIAKKIYLIGLYLNILSILITIVLFIIIISKPDFLTLTETIILIIVYAESWIYFIIYLYVGYNGKGGVTATIQTANSY